MIVKGISKRKNNYYHCSFLAQLMNYHNLPI